MRIRRATDADWPAIWPIWHEVVAAADTYAYPAGLDSEQARELWFDVPPCEVWVAEDEDAGLIGTYHLGPNHSGPGSHIANGSYMVAAAARGQRIGRALVVHSLDRAREAGYRGMQFNAVAATNVYAVRLYEDLGFELIGRVPGAFKHPAEGFVDLLIMFRAL